MLHVLFRPRHPLVRILAGVIAVLVVAAVFALGVFALIAFVAGGLLLWLVKSLRSAFGHPAANPPAQAPAPEVIDGEFTVVRVARPSRPTG